MKNVATQKILIALKLWLKCANFILRAELQLKDLVLSSDESPTSKKFESNLAQEIRNSYFLSDLDDVHVVLGVVT